MDVVGGLLIDIDGVLVVSWESIPGAREAVDALRSTGLPMRFATNTTSRTRAEVAAGLAAAGMAVEPEEILTAPAATAAFLRAEHAGARCFLINEGDLSADLAGVELVAGGPADVVVLGGAGPAYSYEALNQAFRLLRDGAALVAMHRNLAWMTADGMQLDTGGFVRGLEEAACVEATVVGKPSPDFFATAAAVLEVDAGSVVMVGDDVVNDVLGAQAAGMRGILVRTGKFEESALEGLERQPDLILDSVVDLPPVLGG